MRKCAILLLPLLLVATYAADKQWWDNKPYEQWSAKECEKMMHESPWAKTLTIRTPIMRQQNRGSGRTAGADNGTGEREPEVIYTAQMRSAMPVRQAYVRMKEIQAHFDTMAPDAKQRAKQALDGYLAQTFDDKIVILVEYGSNIPEIDPSLAQFWQSRTLATVQNSAYLTDQSGQRVQPTAFVTGSGASREFQFVFPRDAAAAQAHPDAPLAFEITPPPNVGALAPPISGDPNLTTTPLGGSGRMYFKFEPKQMLVAGRVSY